MSPTAPAPDAAAYAARMYDGYKVYGSGDNEIRALDGVSIGFAAGSFTAVMGPSGSGKSTLLQTLSGLDRLTAGAAFIGDMEISALSATSSTRIRRERIGFVFQSFNLIPSIDARRNITLPLTLQRRRVDPERFAAIVTALRLDHRLGHRPAALSGGEQQRVAMARALVAEPEIIFADEPTGNLDTTAGADILGLLRDTVDQWGRTVIMVTHDPVAASRADRVVFLADGRLVSHLDGPTVASIIDHLKTVGV